jgi:CubicO group peptidase (beta-lactamase class C family)
MRPALWPALALFMCGMASAQTSVPAGRLDAHFDALEKSGMVNGSFAVSERGVVRYRRSIGFARIENGIPQAADPGTRYRIGEVTRLFTAALALQFAERGTITLGNRLAEFYPDLPNALEITYRDLLQQRSGLAEYSGANGFGTSPGTPRSRAEVLAAIGEGGVRFPPGQRVEATDTNYLLIGYMLEKVDDRPYADILVRQIAGRLGLVRTYFAGTGIAKTLESESYRWTQEGWRQEARRDPSLDGGARGIVSNANDLVMFMDALFAGKIVTPHSLATMRGEEGNPPIALMPVEVAGVSGVGERGSIEAFDAFVYHFPDRRISIAWTGNASRIPVDQILEESARIIFKRGK